MVFIFYAPSIANSLEYSLWLLALATAQVDALSVSLLARFLLGGLSVDLCDRSDIGEVYLHCSDADVTHTSDIYASVAEFWVCVQKEGADWFNLRVASSRVVF